MVSPFSSARRSIAAVIIAAVALAIACLPGCAAHACSSFAAGDATGCFTERHACHYNWPTGECRDGAPLVCTDFHTDAVGCASHPGNCSMAVVGTPGCIASQPVCDTLDTGTSQCARRSDCHTTIDAVCAEGPAAGSCVLSTTQQACNSNTAECVWDVFLSSCYMSVDEVRTLYPCAYWSGFTPDSQACVYHYCMLTGQVCFDANETDVPAHTADVVVPVPHRDYLGVMATGVLVDAFLGSLWWWCIPTIAEV
jgi:hypothetical protein